ncbi:MAG: VOC family protein [Calditrichaeota bacterium]|nr:VOC family protein [Calditrichota bacterium]
MANAINWFEIPAANFDRAKKFYSQVLGNQFQEMEVMGTKMAFLTEDTQNSVGGAICSGEGYKPSADGALVYLNGGEDLAKPLSRVEAAGGKVVLPKTKISDEIGFMAMFMDSEGNKVAFHSPK